MGTISILDVGHGLCVLVAARREAFVFDCGQHGRAAGLPESWRRLIERTATSRTISSIALSHLHFDHYCGLLEPLPNVSPDLTFFVGRMPAIVDEPLLSSEFLARLIAFTPLDPGQGPLDIDLLRRMRRSAPNLQPKPVSRGDSFRAGAETFETLWPPRSIKLGAHGRAKILKAIDAYDRAAREHKWLRRRLEQIRDEESYNTLLGELDPVNSEEDLGEIESSASIEDEPIAEETSDGLLSVAGRLLREAANDMSLVLSSPGKLLLTGDATKSAMSAALHGQMHSFAVVVTPHHGGDNHVPLAVRHQTLESRVWVSSAGGRLSKHVSDIYDSIPGLHHRTDLKGDIDLVFANDELLRIELGGNRRVALHRRSERLMRRHALIELLESDRLF